MCLSEIKSSVAKATPTSKDEVLFTWDDIMDEIENKSRKLLVYRGNVLDMTKFVPFHPGGELVVEHALRRDATDLFRAFHPDEVLQKKLPHFIVGRLQEDDAHSGVTASTEEADDATDISSSDGSVSDEAAATLVTNTQPYDAAAVTKDFHALREKLEADGLFETNMTFYYLQFVKLFAIFASFVTLVISGPNTTWNYVLAAFINGLYWQQSAFIGHDSGHVGVTQSLFLDNVIGIFFGNFLGGISIGWWKKSHYVHHVVTNHPEHDPDIQHVPFFAISTKFVDNLYSTYHQRTMYFDIFAQCLVSIQHLLYYPIMAFGRFNLYAQSFLYLSFDPKVLWRSTEIAGLVFFWIWYSSLLSFLPDWKTVALYVFISHAFTMILHIQITLSHFAMTTDVKFGKDEEPFVVHQLRTTMDVDCPTWLDWFHGGLQFQVIHHLFPRLPRHNLRKAMYYVKDFAQRHNLPYHSYGFKHCNEIVLSSMRDVARSVFKNISFSSPPSSTSHAHED